MMARPERVGEALKVDTNGCTIGEYDVWTLRPAYQPVYSPVDDDSWSISGFEGLIRIFHGDTQLPPANFFGNVPPQDRVFIECMCYALHIRNFQLVKPEDFQLFLNVDVSIYPTLNALEREIFYTFSQLSRHGLSSRNLVFEILETEVFDIRLLKRCCDMLRSNGFRYALDDFGTNHSNLERYFMLRPDIVKLDRGIFSGFNQQYETRKLLASLIDVFRENGSKVLLEGVEGQEEIWNAADMRVDLLQGFGLAKPRLLPCDFSDLLTIDQPQRQPLLKVIDR